MASNGLDISLPTAISAIINTNWTRINDYYAMFVFPTGRSIKQISDDRINFALKSLTVPAYTQSSIEVYTGGDWMIANGHPDLAKIECTFRDFDDFTLYKGFVDLFEYTLANYKDLSYSSLSVGIGDLKNNTIIHNFDQLLIENVSQLNFDNSTEDQIAEFSVTFRGRRAKVTGAEFYGNVGGSTAAEQNLLETFLNKAKK